MFALEVAVVARVADEFLFLVDVAVFLQPAAVTGGILVVSWVR